MSEDGEQKYSIAYQSDGSYTIEVYLRNASEAILVPQVIKEINENLRIGKILLEIRRFCTEVNGVLIFPKPSKVSDEIRLAACVAAAYPDGFSKSAISDILDIADSSRDAYLNWETKDSSKYLTYNSETQMVHISIHGIDWVYTELQNRDVLGKSQESEE